MSTIVAACCVLWFQTGQAFAQQLADLDRQDERWREAFSLGAISAEELAQYRAGIRRQRAAIQAEAPKPRDFSRLIEAAKTMPLRDLLLLSGATIYWDHGDITLKLFTN